MKKLLLALVFSLFIFLSFATKITYAAGGTFTCKYVTQAAYCQLDANNCTTGYAPDLTLCQAMSGNEGLCNGTSSLPLACKLIGSPPPAAVNKYTCGVNRGVNPPVCYQYGDTCNAGSGPGEQCQSTAIGQCESASYDCIVGRACGTVGGNCCAGQTCTDQFSYCDMNAGGICKACGNLGAACCANPGSLCKTGACSANNICVNVPGNNEPNAPNAPVKGTCSKDTEIDTAIGCVPIGDITALTTFALRWLLGIGGGIAFVMILVAGFQIMTSEGNPQKLKIGQEILTSAVAGLLLIIFSIFVLRLIGVNILGLF